MRLKIDFRRFILVLPLAVLFSGCVSSQGPLYSELKGSGAIAPSVNQGLVLIYSHELPSKEDFRVWANEQLVCSTMGDGKFVYFYSNPGELHIASTSDSQGGSRGAEDFITGGAMNRPIWQRRERLVLKIAPGEIYFVNMHTGFEREKMELVSREEGERRIQTCHWVNEVATASLK